MVVVNSDYGNRSDNNNDIVMVITLKIIVKILIKYK